MQKCLQLRCFSELYLKSLAFYLFMPYVIFL